MSSNTDAVNLFEEKPLPDQPVTADGLLTETKAEAQDIKNCFMLFAGQKALPATLQKMNGAPLILLLQELLNSSDFRTLVLPPLLLREALPHALLESPPTHVFIDWSQRRLPVKKETRQAMGGAKSWAQLLELVLSDSRVLALSSELVTANVEAILKSRLEREPLFHLRRSVIGVVDSSSAFEVRGWAVDLCEKAMSITLEFYADSAFLGSTCCNLPRPDVGDVVGGTGKCGFSFKVSTAHRKIFAGGRTLTVLDSISKSLIGEALIVSSEVSQGFDVLADTRRELAELRKAIERIEARLPQLGQRASIPIEAYEEYWERFYLLSPEMLAKQSEHSRDFAYRPLISVVVPTWNSNTKLLHLAIESVRRQSYDRWELVLSDDASDRDELRSLAHRYASDSRITFLENTKRGGIAENTNLGIRTAKGEYIAFLDHDDELAPDALFQIAAQLQHRGYGLLYSDEDRIETNEFERCVHHTPHFKPNFDPDLLLSLNYICHLVVLRRDVLVEVGGLRSGFDGAQDHDLLLRVTEKLVPDDICHLPRVLYHWRVTPGSVSRTEHLTETIQRNVVAAVNEHLRRLECSAKAEAHNDPLGSSRPFATRVRWRLPLTSPTVSIIVATRDRIELLRPCIQSVIASAGHYPGATEIVILDNDSEDPASLDYLAQLSHSARIRIQRFRGPFNYSAINNLGARLATGEVLVFLNNDTIVLRQDWCAELASHAVREDVGAVGARLLYADGTIQHAGVVTGIEGVAGHESAGDLPQTGGYFGRTQVQRSAAAVTGACLATRKKVFEETGGFDELELKVAFNDVDFCMKVRKAGLRVVYNPFAVLYHLESKSRGREITHEQQQRHHREAMAFRARWNDEDITDPYYNLHFERYARPFERLRPPPEIIPSRGSSTQSADPSRTEW
jgi:O-antigen biosynthesis protein